MHLCWWQLWSEALWFYVFCLPISFCKCNSSGKPWGNFYLFGTDTYFNPRVSWWDVGWKRSQVRVTVRLCLVLLNQNVEQLSHPSFSKSYMEITWCCSVMCSRKAEVWCLCTDGLTDTWTTFFFLQIICLGVSCVYKPNQTKKNEPRCHCVWFVWTKEGDH